MIDKFNVINIIYDNNKNYESIIKNYLENYFESNTHIYHPDYLYQIVWNEKIENHKILELYNNCIEKYIIKIKYDIRNLIKKDKFKLSSLNNLINTLNLQISKIINIFDLYVDIRKTFLIKLLSEPILINFIELELINFDEETITEIKTLCLSISTLSNEYIWFLKLIGKILKNNINNFEYNIPLKYNKLYEIQYILDYIVNIKKNYEFLIDDIINILNPIYVILKDKFIEVINLCSITNLYNLINLKITETFNCDIQFINSVKSSITLYLRNHTDFNINFLRLVILCNDLKLLENYIFIFFEDEKILNETLVIINSNIRKPSYRLFIKSIIEFMSKIKNTDVFLNKYHLFLIERLLSREININNEISIMNTLKLNFSHHITRKIDKVINDYNVSINDLAYYKKSNKFTDNICNFDNITTSYLNWNINYNEGYVNSFLKNKEDYAKQSYKQLKDYIIEYEEYYNTIYSEKRKLQWLLQYGEIDITFNGINITLLPIQLLVLELFNSNISLTINQIICQDFFDNYSNKFKNDIINSLLNSRILKFENDSTSLRSNSEVRLHLSESCDIETDLTDVSYEYDFNTLVSGVPTKETTLLSGVPTQDITNDYELAYSREEIIKSIINHHVKVESVNKNDLYLMVERDIKYFKLTIALFNKSIDSLIEFDYIKVEKDEVIQCIY